MEEITLKKLKNSELIDFYDRAAVQLPAELVVPLTSVVVELMQRREKENPDGECDIFIMPFSWADTAESTAQEAGAWVPGQIEKDFFDSLGYIPKNCIEYVKEEEI